MKEGGEKGIWHTGFFKKVCWQRRKEDLDGGVRMREWERDDIYAAEIMQCRYKYLGLLFILCLFYISRAQKTF